MRRPTASLFQRVYFDAFVVLHIARGKEEKKLDINLILQLDRQKPNESPNIMHRLLGGRHQKLISTKSSCRVMNKSLDNVQNHIDYRIYLFFLRRKLRYKFKKKRKSFNREKHHSFGLIPTFVFRSKLHFSVVLHSRIVSFLDPIASPALLQKWV